MREPAVVLLYGFPAAGKYTVARALAARLEADGRAVRVVDNHYVNNAVFGVLDVDGIKPIPRQAWDRVREVRDVVIRTIRELSPPDFTFVFTNHLVKNHDEWAVDELRKLAGERNCRFVVARLECDIDELCRRVGAADRRARLKWADAEGLRATFAAVEMIAPGEDHLVFDTSATAPEDIAAELADLLS